MFSVHAQYAQYVPLDSEESGNLFSHLSCVAVMLLTLSCKNGCSSILESRLGLVKDKIALDRVRENPYRSAKTMTETLKQILNTDIQSANITAIHDVTRKRIKTAYEEGQIPTQSEAVKELMKEMSDYINEASEQS